jgi:hypothetical protein
MGSAGSDLGAGRADLASPGAGRVGAAAARWPLAFLLWLTPSVGQLVKFAGPRGALLLAGAGAIGIAVVLAWAMAPPAQRRGAGLRWNLLLAVALCAAFAVVYPVAVSGLFGGGSDRADALDVTSAALLGGRLPYEPLTYLGNPPTPMPGAVMLALPFHLIGGAALQNALWFPLFCALAPRIVADRRGAAAYLAIFVLGCPGVLLDFVTGSDFATNAIYVIISAWLMTRLAPDERWPLRFLACLFFACALSARPIYLIEGPIVAGVLLRRDGFRRTIETMAVIAVLLMMINGPIWAAQPPRFPLLLHASLLNIYPRWVHSGVLIPAISIAIACSALFVDLPRGRMWLLSAISLAPVVVPTLLFIAVRHGFSRQLVVLDSYTLPLALFAGLWLLRPPANETPAALAEPASRLSAA